MVSITNDTGFQGQILLCQFPSFLAYGEQSSLVSFKETHQNTKPKQVQYVSYA